MDGKWEDVINLGQTVDSEDEETWVPVRRLRRVGSLPGIQQDRVRFDPDEDKSALEGPNGVRALVNMVGDNSLPLEVIINGLKGLVDICTNNETNCKLVVWIGGLATILNAVQLFSLHGPLNYLFCTMLWTLAYNNIFCRSLLGSEDAIPYITNMIHNHYQDEQLMESACKLLLLVAERKRSCALLVSKGCYAVLRLTYTNLQLAEKEGSEGLSALLQSVMERVETSGADLDIEDIEAASAIEVDVESVDNMTEIVEMLVDARDSYTMMLNCFTLLCMASLGRNQVWTVLSQAGGTRLVIEVMILYNTKYELLNLGLRLLGNFASEDGVLQSLFGQEGGIEFVLDVLKNSPDFHQVALWTLGSLIDYNKTNQIRFAANGGIPLLLPMLNGRAKNDIDFMLRLLNTLVSASFDNEPVQRAMAEEGIVDPLLELLDVHSTQPEIIQQIMTLLACVSTPKQAQKSIVSRRLIDAIRKVMRDKKTDHITSANCVAVLCGLRDGGSANEEITDLIVQEVGPKRPDEEGIYPIGSKLDDGESIISSQYGNHLVSQSIRPLSAGASSQALSVIGDKEYEDWLRRRRGLKPQVGIHRPPDPTAPVDYSNWETRMAILLEESNQQKKRRQPGPAVMPYMAQRIKIGGELKPGVPEALGGIKGDLTVFGIDAPLITETPLEPEPEPDISQLVKQTLEKNTALNPEEVEIVAQEFVDPLHAGQMSLDELMHLRQRRYVDARRYHLSKQQIESVIKIQSVWRGFLVRKRVREKEAAALEETIATMATQTEDPRTLALSETLPNEIVATMLKPEANKRTYIVAQEVAARADLWVLFQAPWKRIAGMPKFLDTLPGPTTQGMKSGDLDRTYLDVTSGFGRERQKFVSQKTQGIIEARHRAATMIQKHWRGYKGRKLAGERVRYLMRIGYRNWSDHGIGADAIQRFMEVQKSRLLHMDQLVVDLEKSQHQRWERMQAEAAFRESQWMKDEARRMHLKRLEAEKRLQEMRALEDLKDLELEREKREWRLQKALTKQKNFAEDALNEIQVAQWQQSSKGGLPKQLDEETIRFVGAPKQIATITERPTTGPRYLHPPRTRGEAATRIQCVWRGVSTRMRMPVPSRQAWKLATGHIRMDNEFPGFPSLQERQAAFAKSKRATPTIATVAPKSMAPKFVFQAGGNHGASTADAGFDSPLGFGAFGSPGPRRPSVRDPPSRVQSPGLQQYSSPNFHKRLSIQPGAMIAPSAASGPWYVPAVQDFSATHLHSPHPHPHSPHPHPLNHTVLNSTQLNPHMRTQKGAPTGFHSPVPINRSLSPLGPKGSMDPTSAPGSPFPGRTMSPSPSMGHHPEVRALTPETPFRDEYATGLSIPYMMVHYPTTKKVKKFQPVDRTDLKAITKPSKTKATRGTHGLLFKDPYEHSPMTTPQVLPTHPFTSINISPPYQTPPPF